MHNYYCKNCNNKYKCYFRHCYYIESKNNNSIYFLDCGNCNKFIGIYCFGEYEILKEEILFNWFLKYKKILKEYLNGCETCNKKKFRLQSWFFKELTFHK